MGKLPKQLELDVLGPSFSRPSLSTYPYSNFWPMFNASSFKISLAPLTRFHQPNYPWATSNSLKLSKTSIPHKSHRPTFQPFLISPPQHLWPAGSSPGWDVGLHCQGLLAMSPQPESRAGENNWCPVVGKAVFLGVPLGMSSSTLYQWNLILCQLPKEERLKGQLHFHRLGNKGWIWGNRQ